MARATLARGDRGLRRRDRPVLKRNGGQASALNAGFARSRGEVVIFLDADDVLLPGAAERALALFHRPGRREGALADVGDRRGGSAHGSSAPGRPAARGRPASGTCCRRGRQLRVRARRRAATHGLVASSSAFCRFPRMLYRISADKHLLELAPFFGELRRITRAALAYRRHAAHSQMSRDVEERLAPSCASTSCSAARDRTSPPRAGYQRRPRRLETQFVVASAIGAVIREIASLPLATDLCSRRRWRVGSAPLGASAAIWPFLDRDGRFTGSPADDATRDRELERLRGVGASYLIFRLVVGLVARALPRIARLRAQRFRCVLDDEHVVAFDLRAGHGTPLSERWNEHGSHHDRLRAARSFLQGGRVADQYPGIHGKAVPPGCRRHWCSACHPPAGRRTAPRPERVPPCCGPMAASRRIAPGISCIGQSDEPSSSASSRTTASSSPDGCSLHAACEDHPADVVAPLLFEPRGAAEQGAFRRSPRLDPQAAGREARDTLTRNPARSRSNRRTAAD